MKPSLLFVYLMPTSFVHEDMELLRDTFDLRTFRTGLTGESGILRFGGAMIRQLVWLLRELPRSTAVYGWFSDFHLFLPVLLGKIYRKKVVVAVAGFDAISLPSLNYGIGTSSWRRPLGRFVLKHADLILPVSEGLVQSTNMYSEWPHESRQGIKTFIPEIRTPMRVVPFGFNPDDWTRGPSERDSVVTTVGLIDSERTLKRKGVDLLIEAARMMPDVRFRLVGLSAPRLIEHYDPPSNFECSPPVPREQLVVHYHGTSVYAQLSRAEGLPNVLCEAMCCGCVPVGSRVFGIPDAIGEAGFLVDTPEISIIVKVLRGALAAADGMRDRARARIVNHFHIEQRRKALIDVFSDRRKV